jgi:hypothetical protein
MNNTSTLLRRILLATLAFGAVGMIAELYLLEHTESATQWIPLVLLIAILIASGWVYLKPSPLGLRIFQGIMLLSALGGMWGVWEHLQGNLEYVREIDPSLGGFSLIWKALHRGAPTLAPGVMVQLALLGLAFTFRHPVLMQPKLEAPRT